MPIGAVVAIVLLLGIAGLATDGGLFFSLRRRAQTAADAAAVAGAMDIWRGSAGTAPQAAATAAAQHGFTDPTPVINIPPTNASPPYLGDSHFVEVIVSQRQPTLFLRALGFDTMTPSARAVAGTAPSADCLITLGNSTAEPGIKMTGSGTITDSGCSLAVNSPATPAISIQTGNSIAVASIDVVGTVSCGTNITPCPTPGAVPAPDPFASLSPPSGSGLPTLTACQSSTHCVPGIYTSTITLDKAGTILDAGQYIFQGAGLKINGGDITGNGVSLYFTSSDTNPCNNCTLTQTNGSLTLNAVTTGSMAGIVIFQDKNVGTSAPLKFSNGCTVLGGVVYAPNNQFSVTNQGCGTGTCPACPASAQYVVRSVSTTGPSFFIHQPPSGTTTSGGITHVALAE